MLNSNYSLDDACFRLRQLIHNPYAIARYLSKSKQVEQQWRALARKCSVSYRRSNNAQ